MKTDKQLKIKTLEKKYIGSSCGGMWKQAIIPLPPKTDKWGNPLFSLEIVPSKKKVRGGYPITSLIIGIPHLEREGFNAYRRVETNMPTFALGNSIYAQGRWFNSFYCNEHKSFVTEFYPPDGAAYLCLDNLFTCVGGRVEWLDKDKKPLEKQ